MRPIVLLMLSWGFGLMALIIIGPLGAVLRLPILPILVASLGIAVRRRHDQGTSGWWIVPLWAAPTFISAGLNAETPGASPTGLVLLASLLSLVRGIWGWVEIGFRRGVAGANRYGANPQAGGVLAAVD